MINFRVCGWWEVKCTHTTQTNRYQLLESTWGKGEIWAQQVVSRGVQIYHEETDVIHISNPVEMIFNEIAIAFSRS